MRYTFRSLVVYPIMASFYFMRRPDNKPNVLKQLFHDVGAFWTVPDGQNTVKKVMTMTKFGGLVGSCIGIYGSILANPRFFYHGFSVFARCTATTTATFATFAVVTNLLAEKRKANDTTNHLVGGFVAGAALGGLARSYQTSFFTGVFFSIIALGIKTFALYDVKLVNDPPLYVHPSFHDKFQGKR